jgi:hypothetical protein
MKYTKAFVWISLVAHFVAATFIVVRFRPHDLAVMCLLTGMIGVTVFALRILRGLRLDNLEVFTGLAVSGMTGSFFMLMALGNALRR